LDSEACIATPHVVDQLRMNLAKNEEMVDLSVCEEEILSLQNVSI